MPRDWGRGVGALVVLGAVWVLVYWRWEPSRGRIGFVDGPGLGEKSPLGGGDAPPVALVSPAPKPPQPAVSPASGAAPPRPPPAPASPTFVPTPKVAVVPPSFRTYTVKKGDTWESIASKEMGSRD